LGSDYLCDNTQQFWLSGFGRGWKLIISYIRGYYTSSVSPSSKICSVKAIADKPSFLNPHMCPTPHSFTLRLTSEYPLCEGIPQALPVSLESLIEDGKIQSCRKQHPEGFFRFPGFPDT
jgi:hypothetical protein